ncbi:purple acid phosphatase family protein [Diplocloster agilis]|uniref:purple acid phosphatase family protein n=1 Tax=Diplocloster agilis TaxID=2850323 RepID=UPI0008203A15|nr:metallophosphoesterase family protein [Suonthocola fibrivorans]MCU6735615.1 metallophosphoesterase family protein [Suonthocola fibrivorans]SCJ78103.1 Exopolysaccharide biosynthesis protein related to N-acetylglucosamine-1-phosphodiester alpha-N-acetylglucosaminidase [uncultured Clostridium sp.]
MGRNKIWDWIKHGAAFAAVIALLLFVFSMALAQKGQYGNGSKTELPETGAYLDKDLIVSGETRWRFQDMVSDGAEYANWAEPDYDDSAWKEAAGSFGVKQGQKAEIKEGIYAANLLSQYTDESRTVTRPVCLFRTEIDIRSKDTIRALEGDILFDDAAVIYLNGELIWAGNTPGGGYAGLLSYGAEETVNSARQETFSVSELPMLKEGKNTIAVELHQANAHSSDIFFDFQSLRISYQIPEQKKPDTSGLILEVGNTAGQVLVNWLTKDKGAYEVQYAPKTGGAFPDSYESVLLGRTYAGVSSTYCYKADMDLALPDTEYIYRIKQLGNPNYSDSYSVASQGAGEAFSFLFAGDPQIGAGEIRNDTMGWEQTLKAGLTFAPDAAFLVSAGDQVDSSDKDKAVKEYDGFRSPQILKELPVAVNPGNHEAGTILYDQQFAKTEDEPHDYAYTYKNVLFLVIDSNNNDYDKHEAFIRQSVESTEADWIIVTMHYALYSAGAHAGDETILSMREALAPVFSRYHVDLVLAGHDHLYTRSYLMQGTKVSGREAGAVSKGQTLYLTAASSSGSKYYGKSEEKLPYAAYIQADEEPLITVVDVDGLRLGIRTFCPGDGRMIDTCTLTKD